MLLASCGDGGGGRASPADTALFTRPFTRPLIDASGKTIGSIGGRPGKEGVVIAIEARSLPPGEHGMHLHDAGRCDPPDFASSGGHWNAGARQHGHDNPKGPHDGDWGNLEVAADGRATTDRLIPRWHGKIPDAGLALVVHARKDDERTDPSGDSGARIACAVVRAPEQAEAQ
jgi:Cu-Zn family superoxide dismutase